MSGDFEPRIVCFACRFCGWRSVDQAGQAGREYPGSIHVIEVPCSGRVDWIYMLRAFETGADGVMIAACIDGNCHYVTGNQKAKKRVDAVRAHLGELGLHPDRLAMYQFCLGEEPGFAQVATEMDARIKELGPTPLREGSGAEWAPEEAA